MSCAWSGVGVVYRYFHAHTPHLHTAYTPQNIDIFLLIIPTKHNFSTKAHLVLLHVTKVGRNVQF